MCTVTWVATNEGFELFVNRDERRGRGRAHPPRLFDGSEARYLAPVDFDAGGTWTAVNDRGLAAALLNYYDAPNPPKVADPISRGLLIPRLMASDSAASGAASLLTLDLGRFRPFTLLLLSSSLPATAGKTPPEGVVFDWDGRSLSRRNETGNEPLCSSGDDTPRALRVRRRLFAALGEPDETIVPAQVREFHCSHLPLRGADSPCMHRREARTVSMTQIVVDDRAVSMRYADGPPCRNPLGEAFGLDRLRATSDDG